MRYFSAALAELSLAATVLALALLLDAAVVAGADVSLPPASIIRCDDSTCRDTVLVPQVPARWPGKVFVNHDDWALTDLGFAQAPDTASFVSNLARWFTGDRPGTFLGYGSPAALGGANLAATMVGAGHAWEVTAADGLSRDLRAYDGVFVSTGAQLAVPSEVIADGGFESASVTPTAEIPVPPCAGFWCSKVGGVGGTVRLVAATVSPGTVAVEIDTRDGGGGRYIFQDVANAAACFRWSFGVLRGQGTNIAELVANWDRSAGDVDWTSAVTFSDTGTAFQAWNAVAQLPLVLAAGVWHTVVVEADARTLSQRLSIDGTPVATVTSPGPTFAPETVILGDTAGTARRGLYTYDHVSVLAAPCEAMDAQVATTPPPLEVDALIDYVHGGGNVYLALDTTAATAERWNPFLQAFGLTAEPGPDRAPGVVPVTWPSPAFEGVGGLFQAGGGSITATSPANPDAAVFSSADGDGRYAIYDSGAVAVPVTIEPGACVARLRRGSDDRLRVAVAGSGDVDVRAIDRRSVKLLGVRARKNRLADVTTAAAPSPSTTGAKDCSRHRRDGRADLLLEFDQRAVVRRIERLLGRPIRHGDVVALTLTGTLSAHAGRTPIVGEDLVIVVDRRAKHGRRDRDD
jgi:hypothetical protein